MTLFEKDYYGTEVATIRRYDDGLLEVVRHKDGTFTLTVHQRIFDSDKFEDCSIILKPRHFSELGKIERMSICGRRDCPSFGQTPSNSCLCWKD